MLFIKRKKSVEKDCFKNLAYDAIESYTIDDFKKLTTFKVRKNSNKRIKVFYKLHLLHEKTIIKTSRYL